MGVRDATGQFLKYLRYQKRVSPHTFKAYASDLHQFSEFLREIFPDTPVEKADYGTVRAWIMALVEEGVKPGSVNRKVASLRALFRYLMKEKVVTRNPMIKVRSLKTQKRLPAFIRESEMQTLLDCAVFPDSFDGVRDRLILEIFYATGIRLSELIALKDARIDLRAQTIRVLGKRNKERLIPFHDNLASLIGTYRNLRDARAKKNHELLFVTAKGDPCYPMMVYRMVRNYLQSYTTTEKRSPHVLRHTYATHLLNNGAEINAVKDLLGHSSLAATQVYTHNSIEKLKKAYKKAHPKA